MARFDELPADQQAVLRLLLTQQSSYEDIARTLRMAPAAVRDRAYEALGALGPSAGAPPHDERAAIGDWLLGRSDDAPAALDDAGTRTWVAAVRAELEPVADGRLPQVPGAAPQGAAATAKPAARAAAPAREGKGSRVGGAILLTGAAILAALALGFVIGRATKDDGSKSSTTAKRTTRSTVIGQANLRPPSSASGSRALGIAQFARQGSTDKINVIAEGLPKAAKGTGYGVWLVSQTKAPVFLGYFQAITTSGQAASQSDLKVDPRDYGAVAITKQRGSNPKTPGQVVLGGQIQFPSG